MPAHSIYITKGQGGLLHGYYKSIEVRGHSVNEVLSVLFEEESGLECLVTSYPTGGYCLDVNGRTVGVYVHPDDAMHALQAITNGNAPHIGVM